MSRFISVPSDFILFHPRSPVCCCLRSFKVPETEISGITVYYKTLSIICVNPRQRNSGDYTSKILCRIRFYRSPRRKLPQFRGFRRFDRVDRGFIDPIFPRKIDDAAEELEIHKHMQRLQVIREFNRVDILNHPSI